MVPSFTRKIKVKCKKIIILFPSELYWLSLKYYSKYNWEKKETINKVLWRAWFPGSQGEQIKNIKSIEKKGIKEKQLLYTDS